MVEIIKLITRDREIDPLVIEEHDAVCVRMNSVDDARALDDALEALNRRGHDYQVRHCKTENKKIDYIMLWRKAA